MEIIKTKQIENQIEKYAQMPDSRMYQTYSEKEWVALKDFQRFMTQEEWLESKTISRLMKENKQLKEELQFKEDAISDLILERDTLKGTINNEVKLSWALDRIEKALEEHHNPAENIMNLIRHVQSTIRKLEDDLNPPKLNLNKGGKHTNKTE